MLERTHALDPRHPLSVAGRFRLLRPLGEGSSATVFLAEEPAHQRRVALKLVNARWVADSAKGRFLGDHEALKRIVHPHVVKVHSSGELADGSLFIAMEYIPGHPLSAVVANRRVSARQALDIAAQCADALGHVHAHDLVHGDVKPANLMITRDAGIVTATLIDFGLATHINDRPADRSKAPLYGTPRYISPEQVSGAATAAPSDVYNLGLVLYELLAKSPVVASQSVLQCLMDQVQTIPPPPSHVEYGEITRAVEPMLMQMLDKRPANRPTASQVAGRLRRLEYDLDRDEFDEEDTFPPVSDRWLERLNAQT